MTAWKTLNSLRSPMTAVIVLGLLVLIAIGARARAGGIVEPATPSVPVAGRQPVTVNTQREPVVNGPAQVVRFTLYDVGIFPYETRVTAGQVAVYLEDRTGTSEGLIVQNSERVIQGRALRGARQARGSIRMALIPGRYQVFDASRPTNIATLIVER